MPVIQGRATLYQIPAVYHGGGALVTMLHSAEPVVAPVVASHTLTATTRTWDITADARSWDLTARKRTWDLEGKVF